MSVTPTIGDALLVKNTGPADIQFKWDGRTWNVRANGQGLVPFEAIINEMGDPRSGAIGATHKDQFGTNHVVQTRELEFKRLKAKRDPASVDGEFSDDTCIVNPLTAEVYDPDTMERIYTVQDDYTGAQSPSYTSEMNQEEEIKKLRRQLDMMERSMQAASVNPTINPTDIPTDDEDGPSFSPS